MTVTGSSRGAATTAATDLKAKHRAMWASGDYAGVAEQVIPTMGQALVEACRVQPGQRVLDVAAGSGNAAIPAARLGADVVAADLTPELLERGKAAAEGEGLKLEWREADAEAMPFDDDTFDVTLSCVGVMFAPHHQASADELVRVTRPGGTVKVRSSTARRAPYSLVRSRTSMLVMASAWRTGPARGLPRAWRSPPPHGGGGLSGDAGTMAE